MKMHFFDNFDCAAHIFMYLLLVQNLQIRYGTDSQTFWNKLKYHKSNSLGGIYQKCRTPTYHQAIQKSHQEKQSSITEKMLHNPRIWKIEYNQATLLSLRSIWNESVSWLVYWLGISQVVDVIDWVVWEVLFMLLLEKLLGFSVRPENHSNVRRYGMVPIPVQVVPVPVLASSTSTSTSSTTLFKLFFTRMCPFIRVRSPPRWAFDKNALYSTRATRNWIYFNHEE